jgi:hypothetical protein
MDPGNQTRPCLDSFLKQEDIASRNYCLYRDFVNQHLQNILNFSCNHYSYTAYMKQRVRSKFGYILFDSYVDKHSSLQGLANPKFAVELIAPHKPTQVNDFAELVHGLEYKIVIKAVTELEDDLNFENLTDYLRRVKFPYLLTTKHVIFMNRATNMNKNLPRESKRRVASLVQATSEKSKDQLRVLNIRNPKANCQFVKKILGYELIFLVFGNAMGQIQMQLFKQFYHSGLIEHWKQLATSQSEAVNGRSLKFKTFNDTQVLLRSLIPVYFLCVSLLTSATLILLAEMSVERCSKNYLARRKED